MRKYQTRKKNNLILGALAIILITMAVGYSIFSSNLNITGTSNISNNWDIRISKVEGTLGGQAAHAKDTNENEINPECDNDTSNPKSCGEGLTVTFSDLFYYEGDSSTYTITLKNSGSLDASLTQNVEPVITSNSDKIKVELEGFKTKGQILAKNDTQTTTLTITYLSETALADTNNKIKPLSNTKTITPRLLDNEEQQPEVSITITYPFVQDSESGAVTSEKHLVEYDCTTNGGTSCTNYKEYVTTGQSVNLDNEGTEKEKYAFLGWNTDKDAEEGLTTLTMGNNDIKLYAIYKKDSITFNSVTTTSTTNSITVVASASALSEIVKYEYSTDGETYYEGSIDTENNNSTYTFTGLNQNTSYPIYVKVTTKSGKSDVYEVSGVDLTENVVTEGDGLYQDETDIDGRYTYRGSNPNNYLTFNGEEAGWRIVSIESDGTYKIIKTDSIGQMAWDTISNRSSSTDTYCTNASNYGCNAWAKTSSLVSPESNLSTALASGTFHQYGTNGGTTGTDYSGTVTKDASLNTYLNENYYVNILKSDTNIDYHAFNVSTPGNYQDTESISTNVEQEKLYKWNGHIGLITATDYMRASTSNLCTSINAANDSSYPCKNDNYLYNNNLSWWTISPETNNERTYVLIINNNGGFGDPHAFNNSVGVRPVLFLKAFTKLTGDGTQAEPFKVSEGVDTKKINIPTFVENEIDNGVKITIDYHKECGSNGITCTYIKNGETTENLTGSTQTVDYTEDGTLVATISDGTNTVSTSSYTIKILEYASNYITSLALTDNTLITDNYGNIRYSGLNVNNYVCMDNTEQTCDNINNLYRIIGVFNNIKKSSDGPSEVRLKVVKATNNGNAKWSDRTNYWGYASLMSTLNNKDSFPLYSNELIEEAVWNLGGANTNEYSPSTMYNKERGTTTGGNNSYPYTWTGKIGLMYPSDYGYASSSCYSVNTLNKYSNSDCTGSNWLWNGVEWLLTPGTNSSYYAYMVTKNGFISSMTDVTGVLPNRPSFYLNSTTKIIANTNHNGTSSKPYIVGKSLIKGS